MEVRGTPEEEKEARDTTKDFADWERLGAELPEIYSAMPPGNASDQEQQVVVENKTQKQNFN